MAAEAWVAVDLDGAVREWVRSLGLRAFFGVNNAGTFPQVIVMRVAGPDLDALYQFDCWADTKKEASDTAAELATALSSVYSFDHDGVRIHGANWSSTRWLPDGPSDKPRYIVDATFSGSSI